MIPIVLILVIVALGLFFVVNKSNENRRANRRQYMEERKEIFMEQLRQMNKKKGEDK